ncbi:MAG TPA: mannose-6-phosphate isomerase, class I [Chitinophagaceae bacterium]|jgi:mannose-6-phosphate isomerase|nr:mannose-6-phosphate isomerase, class I [Chitinophagaceae bacterium]
MAGDKMGVYKLKGIIRNYDWGGTEYLSLLLSYPNSEKKPMAEYWLGAHDADPSVLVIDGDKVRLNRFIADNKENILGKTVAKKFGRLPYLLKLLDVKDMLSIQVHPAKHEAEVEFERENKEGIPLDAPHRNYKDDNHKPEFIVALSDFWLLHGFKPAEKLKKMLQSIPELEPLLEIFDASGYDQLYKTAMEMPQESVNQLLQSHLERIIPLYKNGELKKEDENFWAARAALTFNQQSKIDRGIFSIFFFNLLYLNPGEGIFQDAGVPHAYLEGQNVEIMANSDNVLRGGLTNKHIDVKELMKHVKFEETIPNVTHAQKINIHEELYRTAAPDFKLSRFQLKKADTGSFQSATGEILLVLEGTVLISSGVNKLELERGEAAFITSYQHVSLEALAETVLFRASVPVHSSD